jgi:hypothetical protein
MDCDDRASGSSPLRSTTASPPLRDRAHPERQCRHRVFAPANRPHQALRLIAASAARPSTSCPLRRHGARAPRGIAGTLRGVAARRCSHPDREPAPRIEDTRGLLRVPSAEGYRRAPDSRLGDAKRGTLGGSYAGRSTSASSRPRTAVRTAASTDRSPGGGANRTLATPMTAGGTRHHRPGADWPHSHRRSAKTPRPPWSRRGRFVARAQPRPRPARPTPRQSASHEGP